MDAPYKGNESSFIRLAEVTDLLQKHTHVNYRFAIFDACGVSSYTRNDPDSVVKLSPLEIGEYVGIALVMHS